MSTIPNPAPYVRTAEPGVSHHFLGHLFTYLAEGHETGGLLTALEVVVRKGLEPPPHIHTREDEYYYVLDGVFTFAVGDETFEAGPGTFMSLPRGVSHTFTVEADGARALVLATPGGMEAVFRHFSTPADELVLPPVPEVLPFEEMIAVDGLHGVTYLAPSGPSP